ncbi:hypothetical protein [Hyphomonas sp.]|uniref:hypothetical protein n=1 Tax=Hyphomonas sp. TaxID=87 RepID=UPI000C983F68|nr:hypothetical protein [Hyphomonas sp.]MAL43772.1 hypothetical protein [Hyphomonas sp.]
MSKKNLSESITEAWNAAVEIGRKQDEIKEQREREVDAVFCDVHEKIMHHLVEQTPTDPRAPLTAAEKKRIDDEMAAAKKREEEEIARRDAEAQAANKNQILDKEEPPTPARRLPAGYAGRGTNYGGAVAVGQMAPRELSPEERERQRAEQEGRMTARETEIRAGMSDEEKAKLDAIKDREARFTATVRAGRLQRDADKIAAGDMDSEGRMTRQGREKRLAGQQRVVDRRVQRLENEIARLSALDDGRDRSAIIGRKKAEIAGLRGNMEGARLRFDQDVESGRIARAPDTTTGDTNTGAGGGGAGGGGDDGPKRPGDAGYEEGGAAAGAYRAGEKTREVVGDIAGKAGPGLVGQAMGAVAGALGLPAPYVPSTAQRTDDTGARTMSPEGEVTYADGREYNPITGTFRDPDSPFFQGIADLVAGPDYRRAKDDLAMQDLTLRQNRDSAQFKLDMAYKKRPNVPAGVYPLEDENYRAWFSTLGDAEKNMEIQRIQEKPRDPLASAPPDPSKPPPTVG